ncbi:MAG TPA: formate--tetrahydrofolate ligase [Thermoplasmata archaeon]|nr:formate--tetrahydrofolate ligase [Thermoplasmata archaeon]
MRSVREIGDQLGLSAELVRPAGAEAGKVPVAAVRERRAHGTRGKLVLVTGMTPTRHGEGKTVTVIGLTDGLAATGHGAVACLRQPSLGPVFGVKGGATGGGRATVEPSTTINLGFTGDIHAVATAHNLLAALVDNHIFHGNPLGLDPARILWPRTLDMEDRALRHVVTGPPNDPRHPTESGAFVIAAASEVMAILALAGDYADLRQRLGRILVGARTDGSPVRATDLRAEGAMAAVLRDALEPNLVRTAEGAPAIIHAGPFGNIAHGTCSRLAIELGLYSTEYCVVEAGFSTELGAEKFVDIVTPVLGTDVDAAVLVATLRGLRVQGGAPDDVSGQPNLAALKRGLENLEQHVANLAALGLAGVIALNRFPGDSPEEIEALREFGRAHGLPVVESRAFADGGEGCRELADAVRAAAALGRRSHPLSPPTAGPVEQLRAIVTRLYGGTDLALSPDADRDLAAIAAIGELAGPVCVAKTPLSLSDDPHRLGRPTGFTSPVHRFTRSAGAGFTVAYLGSIETMPGLPAHPASEKIDLTPDGRIVGLG